MDISVYNIQFSNIYLSNKIIKKKIFIVLLKHTNLIFIYTNYIYCNINKIQEKGN